MLSLFRALAERLRAMFAAQILFEAEAELLSHHAERKAELLRQAAAYDREGLTSLAEEVRSQADRIQARPTTIESLTSAIDTQPQIRAEPPTPTVIGYQSSSTAISPTNRTTRGTAKEKRPRR